MLIFLLVEIMVIQNFKSGRVLRSKLPFILPLRRQARCIIYLFLCNILLKKQYLKTAININPQSFYGQEFGNGFADWIGPGVFRRLQSSYWPGCSYPKPYVGFGGSVSKLAHLTWLASWCLLLVGPALSFFSCGLQHELLDYFTTC